VITRPEVMADNCLHRAGINWSCDAKLEDHSELGDQKQYIIFFGRKWCSVDYDLSCLFKGGEITCIRHSQIKEKVYYDTV
jgi:hypothetical protein